MAQKKEVLLAQAKTLNLNVEGLDYNGLRAAVKAGHAAASDTDKGSDGEIGGADTSSEAEKEKAPVAKPVKGNATVARQLAAKETRKKKTAAAKVAAKAKSVRDEEASGSLSKKEGKDTRKSYTDDRKLVFKFKKSAPESINVDGVSRKVSELIEDESVMMELVHGNSNFIEQIH